MISSLIVIVIFVAFAQATLTQEQRLKKLENYIHRLSEDNEHLKSKVKKLENRFETGLHKGIVRSRRQPTPTNVAFTAYISPWNLTNIGSHETIVFDRTSTNVGLGYDIGTGVFRAPTTGLYVFVIDAMVDPLGEADLHLMKSYSGGYPFDVTALYASGRFTNTYSSSSRSVILSLNTGDEVWVQNGFTTLIELHGNGFTTFSGWMLRPGSIY